MPELSDAFGYDILDDEAQQEDEQQNLKPLWDKRVESHTCSVQPISRIYRLGINLLSFPKYLPRNPSNGWDLKR